jgi:hypothetical protein
MVNNETSNVCNFLDLMLKQEGVVRNFFPQGESLDSKIPSLVVVHPFYFGFNGNKYLHHSQMKDFGRYIPNIRCLLSKQDRNIFLFESYKYSSKTLEVLSSWRGNLNGVYLIKTQNDSSMPIEAGKLFDEWKNMAQRMLDVSSEFEFAGGELYGNIKDTSSLTGCLGGAFRELDKCGVKGNFKEGVCFQSLEHAGS